MTSGKRDTPPSPPTAGAAARVAKLVSGADPAAQKALADRHLARTRNTQKRSKSSRSMPAVRPAASEPASYLRPTPTRSRVLNAFLHEAGATLLPPAVGALDDASLAPKLVEIARKYMAPLAAAAGNVEAALRIAAELPEVTSVRVAELVLRRAFTAPGALGVIARDYDEHRRRAGAVRQDDLVGRAILAAFAGRVVAHALRLLGPRVRDEVQAALRSLVASRTAGSARGLPESGAYRKNPVRTPSIPEPDVRHDKKRGTA
jgi:hypothetical protein